eukprot:TRINITY_DN2169_c0_g1_i5.p1 TRINITY_DN2169_c0_g1~~TRINITY_DN2169_c0_g1_i5.p1  ORF type:complete len:280 (+),score=-17.01 TRINITY_DN2169_c0_g1_i5:273-1112(+)
MVLYVLHVYQIVKTVLTKPNYKYQDCENMNLKQTNTKNDNDKYDNDGLALHIQQVVCNRLTSTIGQPSVINFYFRQIIVLNKNKHITSTIHRMYNFSFIQLISINDKKNSFNILQPVLENIKKVSSCCSFPHVLLPNYVKAQHYLHNITSSQLQQYVRKYLWIYYILQKVQQSQAQEAGTQLAPQQFRCPIPPPPKKVPTTHRNKNFKIAQPNLRILCLLQSSFYEVQQRQVWLSTQQDILFAIFLSPNFCLFLLDPLTLELVMYSLFVVQKFIHSLYS